MRRKAHTGGPIVSSKGGPRSFRDLFVVRFYCGIKSVAVGSQHAMGDDTLFQAIHRSYMWAFQEDLTSDSIVASFSLPSRFMQPW